MNLESKFDAPVKTLDLIYVGGRWAKPSIDAKIEVINSGTEKHFFCVAEAKEAHINAAVAAARSAFDRGQWPGMTHADRVTHLRAIGDELDNRLDDGAPIWTTESGVLHGIGKKSLAVTHEAYRYYAGLAESFPIQERHTPKGGGSVGLLVS